MCVCVSPRQDSLGPTFIFSSIAADSPVGLLLLQCVSVSGLVNGWYPAGAVCSCGWSPTGAVCGCDWSPAGAVCAMTGLLLVQCAAVAVLLLLQCVAVTDLRLVQCVAVTGLLLVQCVAVAGLLHGAVCACGWSCHLFKLQLMQ